jgi:hypothetical protein
MANISFHALTASIKADSSSPIKNKVRYLRTYEHPVVLPHVLHFMQVPLRTSV